jgi:hypothetical protein
MKEFKDLTNEDQKVIFNNAFTFLHDHADHVHSLFDKQTPIVAPSGSDLWHPELWKGIHWAWFVVSGESMGEWTVDNNKYFTEEKLDTTSKNLFNKIKDFFLARSVQ